MFSQTELGNLYINFRSVRLFALHIKNNNTVCNHPVTTGRILKTFIMFTIVLHSNGL